MPDRRRFAIVVTPLFALLAVAAAVLLPSGAAPAAAQSPGPAAACFEITVGWRICAPPAATAERAASQNSLAGCRPRALTQATHNDPDQLSLDPCELPPTTLTYGAPVTTGSVTDDGDYAFLTDPDDLTTLVTTYEGLRDGLREGNPIGLVLHQNDGDGASQEAFYDLVEVNDVVEWREADDCWMRYVVREVHGDPAGDPPRTLLTLQVYSHPYPDTGCTGALRTTGSRTFTWSPANLRSPDMTIPIRHGPWQLIPLSWTGARETEVRAMGPPELLTESADLDTARQHRLWRQPDLPAGWRLFQAFSWTGSRYGGIEAWYTDTDGVGVIRLIIFQLSAIAREADSTTTDHQLLIVETRVIDGHPAYVEYSPADSGLETRVSIYDEATGVVYFVAGQHPTLRGTNIDATIAIARSLYR